MDTSTAIYAIRWLVRDTFRQARASGIFWLMLAVSGLCMLFCLSVGVQGSISLRQGDDPPEFWPRKSSVAGEPVDEAKLARHGVRRVKGEMTLAFGAFHVELGRDAEDAVRGLQLILAGGIAGALGILLALVWTAGFLPTFLDPHAVAVLLAKPVPRWSLLAGKYVGVLAFVAFQAAVFVIGTWAMLGLRTGVWHMGYLLSIFLLLLHFSIFFSVSTLLAVSTRSTVACVFGAVVFWLLCWGMNYGHHAALTIPEIQQALSGFSWLTEAAYWIMPKPADMGIILSDVLHASGYFSGVTEFKTFLEQGRFHPELSIFSSFLFSFFLLTAAAWQFGTMDY